MALSGCHLEVPNKVHTCASWGHSALHAADRLIQVEDIIFHWGKEFIQCAMIIFRGFWSRGMTLALDGWHSAGQLTGVCVCVCLVSSTSRLDLRTPKREGWNKEAGKGGWREGRFSAMDRGQEEVTINWKQIPWLSITASWALLWLPQSARWQNNTTLTSLQDV